MSRVALAQRIELLLSLHRPGEAEQLAREALAAHPDWAVGHSLLALGLRGVRPPRLDEALTAARRGVALNPMSSWAHAVLGSVLAGLQDADGTEAAFREALRPNPADTFARSQLGWSLLERGKSYAAVVVAEEGLADSPDDALLLELLAAAEMGIFDFPTHARTVAHALSIHPQIASFHHLSGLLLKRATRWCQSGLPSFEAVIAAHAEAVRLSPAFEPYQEALEQARQMLAQFQEELPYLPADPLPDTEEDGEDAPPEPDDLAAEAAEYHSELLAGSDGDAEADDYQPLPLTRWARRVDRCRMWLGVGCVVVAWGGGALAVVVYGLLHLVKALGK